MFIHTLHKKKLVIHKKGVTKVYYYIFFNVSYSYASMIYHIHIYFVNPALRNKPNIYLGGGLSNRKRYSSQPQLSSSTDHLLGSADYINESADMLEKESGRFKKADHFS